MEPGDLGRYLPYASPVAWLFSALGPGELLEFCVVTFCALCFQGHPGLGLTSPPASLLSVLKKQLLMSWVWGESDCNDSCFSVMLLLVSWCEFDRLF